MGGSLAIHLFPYRMILSVRSSSIFFILAWWSPLIAQSGASNFLRTFSWYFTSLWAGFLGLAGHSRRVSLIILIAELKFALSCSSSIQ
jgi:hypothetical protein